MYENMEMRAVMRECLKKEMLKDQDIVLIDADLAKPNGIQPLFAEFPDRCFDAGIAEGNMVCMAAGLASVGLKPFAFTFAPFIARRACDQAALSVAYARQNVKLVGTDPGIGQELNGATHMSTEDVGIMRSIPGFIIFEPTDGDQLAKALPQILAHEGPMYIRTPRKKPMKTWFADEGYEFYLFKADIMKEGSDVTLISSGMELTPAMEAAERLADIGIHAEVVNVHTVKPLDTETILASVKKTGCAVTCENHNIIGGIGSAVSELLCKEYPAPVERIGFQDCFGEVGFVPYLRKRFQMDADSIVSAAETVISRKR